MKASLAVISYSGRRAQRGWHRLHCSPTRPNSGGNRTDTKHPACQQSVKWLNRVDTFFDWDCKWKGGSQYYRSPVRISPLGSGKLEFDPNLELLGLSCQNILKFFASIYNKVYCSSRPGRVRRKVGQLTDKRREITKRSPCDSRFIALISSEFCLPGLKRAKIKFYQYFIPYWKFFLIFANIKICPSINRRREPS